MGNKSLVPSSIFDFFLTDIILRALKRNLSPVSAMWPQLDENIGIAFKSPDVIDFFFLWYFLEIEIDKKRQYDVS